MATFVMIHGAWHGGWCFDTLRPLLEAKGHQMIAPDLPGMGGSEAELAAVTLGGWADYVAAIVRDADAPVILCGHSRGGVVISETAERVPEKMAALVYICAMLLPSGMSREEMRKVNDPNPDFNAIRSNVPGGTVIDKSMAVPIFAQLSPPDLAAAAAARLVAEPAKPMGTMLALTEARYGSVPRHYIECLHDRTIPISDQRRMQTLQPCASVTSLAADHSPFLSTPTELAGALIAVAEGLTP
ncbi:MAG: alpha/beta fold hydrolase [Sphingomonadaceae bacterium]